MGTGVVVYGYIDCPGYGWQVQDKRVFRHNRRVLKSLPDSDPDWPFITRNMFSVLPLRPSVSRCIPQYESQVIHFAGSYKNMYVLDAAWLHKFESLLSKLCWFEAVAMVDFSRLRYQWSVNMGDVSPGYSANPPVPPAHWAFSCTQWAEEPAPSTAIDEQFESVHHVAHPPRD